MPHCKTSLCYDETYFLYPELLANNSSTYGTSMFAVYYKAKYLA